VISALGDQFDVIIASFALHHLSSADKLRFLAAARMRLTPGGELLLIDVVRRDGESRAEYVQRYATEVIPGWAIPKEIRQRVLDHVRSADYPEEISAQPTWARQVGFTDVTGFYQGGNETQAAWRMSG
jgi:tRNA (cmo5U34)-methyltransferase